MERVKSAQMQLGRLDFVEASLSVLTVADTVAISLQTQLWLLASFYVVLLNYC